MKIQLLRNRRLFVIASASIMICLVAASAWSSRMSPRQEQKVEQLPLYNKTQGLAVVSFERTGNTLRLELKNNYSKDITAYALSVDKGESVFRFSEDFIQGDTVIVSGSSYSLSIPMSRSRTASGEPDLERRFNVLAAVFADHTSDGDPDAIRVIEADRTGSRQFLTHVLPLLRDFIDQRDENESTEFTTLVSRVLSLQVSSSTESNHDVMSGYNSAKERILRDLEEIKRPTDNRNLREKLKPFEKRQKDILTRL